MFNFSSVVIINMNHEITSLFIYPKYQQRYIIDATNAPGDIVRKVVFRHLTVSERMVKLLCALKGPWSTDG